MSIRGGVSGHLRGLSRSVVLAAGLALSGCSDVLAVLGVTDLSGYWEGRYDADFDFYLDLDDDLYGVYGRGGLRYGSQVSDLWVDGERDGPRVRFYAEDEWSDQHLLFEGQVTGADRLEGYVYLEPIPEYVVLHRH